MLLFFVFFLVVRGTPALVLYRKVLDARARMALALMSSTQLPLVLAITALATSSGHMRASTAAALVGAAVLSTLIFPFLALRLRGDLDEEAEPAQGGAVARRPRPCVKTATAIKATLPARRHAGASAGAPYAGKPP